MGQTTIIPSESPCRAGCKEYVRPYMKNKKMQGGRTLILYLGRLLRSQLSSQASTFRDNRAPIFAQLIFCEKDVNISI